MLPVIANDLTRIAETMASPDGIAAFASFANLVPIVLYAKDLDGRVTLANSVCRLVMTGSPTGEVLGRTEAEISGAEIGRLHDISDRQVIRDRQATEHEVQRWDQSRNAVRVFLTMKAPIIDAKGRCCGVVIAMRDITERKRMEEALRTSEERFVRAVSAARIATWEWDAVTESYSGSEGREAILGGLPGDQRTNEDILTILHPDDVARFQQFQAAARACREGRSHEIDFRIITASGETRWLRSVGRAEVTPEGELRRVSGALMDITDLKTAEIALEQALARSEAQDRAKSKFLAAASHDLRQPMQALEFFVNGVRPFIMPGGEVPFERLERGILLQRSLLDGLLDVTRLDSNLIEPSFEDFPITELIDQIAATHRPTALRKGLHIFPVPTTALVRSDRMLLTRMLNNLVENAVRYTTKGRVLIDCVTLEDCVEVSVRDSGIGIAEHEIESIWEEFHQVGSTSRERRQGMGLGLSIVQRIARLLRYPIAVQSRLGEGTTFSLRIPLSAAHCQPMRPVTTKPPTTHAPPPSPVIHRQRPLVLVVDDDPMLREAFESIFEGWEEWQVVLAGSLEEAKIRTPRRPEAVVMDYHLNGQMGDAAIVELRRYWSSNLPAVLLTGDTDRAADQDAAAQGMTLLHKPVEAQRLHATLVGLLRP